MFRVLWFIVVATARNRVKVQLRRMRQPRYLVATLAGLAYFWFFFGRRVFAARPLDALPDELRPVLVAGVCAVALALLSTGWLLGKKRAELAFTEAEIQLLFPGPTSRRSLLLYKISRSLVLVFLSTLVMTLLFGARLSGNPLFFAVGAWLALSSFSLHETGATLTRAGLLLRGARGVLLLVLGVSAAVAAIALVAWWSLRGRAVPALDPQNLKDLGAAIADLSTTPLGILLYPIRAPVQTAVAKDWAGFFSWLPGAVAVLAAHIGWVLRTEVAFEEASVEAAERRARLVEARRGRGRRSTLERPKASLALAAAGRPEWALAWKNLIAARRLLGSRIIGLVLPFAVMGFMFGFLAQGGWGGRFIGAALSFASFAVFLIFMGPSALRTDFRMDHANIDILRTLPLSGVQVVFGQVLGPVVVLALLQWAAIGLAFALSLPLELDWLPIPLRAAVAISAALVGPPLAASGLLIQNAVVLLFPTWASTGVEQSRGFEGMGQRLLTLAGSLVVMLVGVMPAAAAGGVTLFLVWITLGPLGAPIAAAVASAVLTAELAGAVFVLGKVFDRYDVTA